jgi:hypothetical protein
VGAAVVAAGCLLVLALGARDVLGLAGPGLPQHGVTSAGDETRGYGLVGGP